MEIIIANHAGFCFGVKRALQLVEKLAAQPGEVATLGGIIHNPQVIEKLREAGVRQIESPEEISSGTLVLSCHGVGPEARKAAEESGLEVVDATCPFVARAQEYVSLLAREGYHVVIFGDRGHREVIGLVGHAGGKAQVLESPEEAERMPFARKLGVVVQTTQEQERYFELLGKLGEKCGELRAFNTICEATVQRQKTAVELAREVDLMIVIGGHISANTRRLAEVCAGTGVEVRHIETAGEISPQWLAGKERVGITAGASTAQWLIDEVVAKLKSPGGDSR